MIAVNHKRFRVLKQSDNNPDNVKRLEPIIRMTLLT